MIGTPFVYMATFYQVQYWTPHKLSYRGPSNKVKKGLTILDASHPLGENSVNQPSGETSDRLIHSMIIQSLVSHQWFLTLFM